MPDILNILFTMVIFSEILPNPVGKDSSAEWIKLSNNSNELINLSGWKIKDDSGKTFIFQQEEISPQGVLILSSGKTKITLNNNGDRLFLYNQENKLIDSASYDSNVAEGVVLYREANSSILKQKSIVNKSTEQTEINLTDQVEINQANIINSERNAQYIGHTARYKNPVSGNLIIIILAVFAIAIAFFIIIKKLNLLEKYENQL